MWHNRRKLRTQPLDVNFAMQQYVFATLGNVEKLIQENGKRKYPPDAGQLCFIFDRAEALIETMRSDRQADQPTVEACLQKLAEARGQVEALCARPNILKELAHAKARKDYLTMEKLEDGFYGAMKDLRDTRLKDLDMGQADVLKEPEKNRKIKRILSWLLFFIILTAFAWGIWQLNLIRMTQ